MSKKEKKVAPKNELEAYKAAYQELHDRMTEIQSLALGGLDMSTKKFTAFVTEHALKIANKATGDAKELLGEHYVDPHPGNMTINDL